ncbi:MAG: glycosyl hydrolase family 18 protein [Acidimicrobiales bacterium]
MNQRSPRGLQPTAARTALVSAVSFIIVTCTSCALPGASGTTPASRPVPTSPYSRYLSAERRGLASAISSVHVALPHQLGAPAPNLPSGAFGKGLGSKEVLGFLPSWELSQAGTIDYSALSEVSYYALQVEPGGTLLEQGPGWTGLESGSVATLVSAAHQVGTRALLTLFTQTQSTLQQLSNAPSSAGAGLADRVAVLLQAHGFDGVDLDLEGQLTSSRQGFVQFIAAFSRRLRAIDPTWAIVLNTFPQSAVDSQGFFDVQALAPYVDRFFVMAYDMSDQQVPGATAPLVGAELSDASTLASYAAAVPASKVLLGIPFYGYDFTATRAKLPANTIGSPYAVTYKSIVATGRTALWDPVTETPYVSFRRSGQWHQTWFDDPTSIALKVAMAASFKVAGVGAWELGMAAGQPAMTNVLDGGSPPRRLPLATQP